MLVNPCVLNAPEAVNDDLIRPVRPLLPRCIVDELSSAVSVWRTQRAWHLSISVQVVILRYVVALEIRSQRARQLDWPEVSPSLLKHVLSLFVVVPASDPRLERLHKISQYVTFCLLAS